jgi:hypothetical protein
MAAGAAPAPEKTLEADKNQETVETPQQPTTWKQRFIERLHKIFAGRDEYLGWRQ